MTSIITKTRYFTFTKFSSLPRTRSCQNDDYSYWQKFHQEDISVSVYIWMGLWVGVDVLAQCEFFCIFRFRNSKNRWGVFIRLLFCSLIIVVKFILSRSILHIYRYGGVYWNMYAGINSFSPWTKIDGIFADDILRSIFMNEKFCISTKVPLLLGVQLTINQHWFW